MPLMYVLKVLWVCVVGLVCLIWAIPILIVSLYELVGDMLYDYYVKIDNECREKRGL